MSVMLRKKRRALGPLGLGAAITIAYCVVFLALFPIFGERLAVLTVVLVSLAGWQKGIKGGILAAAAAIPLNAGLAFLVGHFHVAGFFRWTPGELVIVGVGLATGLARMHFDRLKSRARELDEARQVLEEEMGKLAQELIEAQERSHERFAMELHDGLCQTLVAAHRFLEASANAANEAGESEARRHAAALVAQALRECRSLMNDMYPRVLRESGLVATIREELAAYRQSLECTTTFHANGPVELPPDTKLTLYRVFHEALTNIRKHATGATSISVSLEQHHDSVTITIKDDGPGFDVKSATREQHLGGLMTMRRRVEMARGTFHIASGPGQGTTVTATVRSTTGRVKGLHAPRGDQVPSTGRDQLLHAGE